MEKQTKDRKRDVLSAKTKTIAVGIFAVVWLATNIYEQARFAGRHERSAIEAVGDYTQFAIPAAGFAGSLIVGDITGAFQFVLGCITNTVATTALKQGIDTTRPNGDKHSFPSGHTAFAFQGAAFIQRRYGWKVGILAFLAAGYVGLSRIEADMHWPVDVAAGAAIGMACSYIFTRPLKREDRLVGIAPKK